MVIHTCAQTLTHAHIRMYELTLDACAQLHTQTREDV